MIDINQDQTRFANQEPIFEDLETIAREEAPVAPKKSLQKRTKILIGVAVVSVILVVLLASTMLNQPVQNVLEPSPSPDAQIPEELDPLMQRITILKDDLEAADPTRLPFLLPPVDYDITLEK